MNEQQKKSILHAVEIKKLFAFCTVCETLSFTAAAKSLNLGQSTISHHIATLEKELKVDLIKRTSRSVELTHEGKKVYVYVKKIFEAFKSFENYLLIKDIEPIGKLCVYGGENSLLALVVESIQTFKDKFPKIHFDIMGVNKIPEFSPHQLNVGIFEKIEKQPHILQDYLMTFHLGLYASKAYLTRFGEPKSMEDLSHHRLIVFENQDIPFSPMDMWLLTFGLPEGQKRSPYLIINTIPLTYGAAYAGLGIVTIPREIFLIKQGDLVELLPDIPKPELKAYFTSHYLHQNHPSVIAFKTHLQETIVQKGWK